MEKHNEFDRIVSSLKDLHPNFHNFLDELMAKIYPIWMGKQDKTKTHFIYLIGLESKELGEQILFDVINSLGWMKKDFHQIQFLEGYCRPGTEILYMLQLHKGFPQVSYFSNPTRFLSRWGSRDEVDDNFRLNFQDWLKNRNSLQIELDGNIYTAPMNGNLVIHWIGERFDNTYSRSGLLVSLWYMMLEQEKYEKLEFPIELPLPKEEFLEIYLGGYYNRNLLSPNDCLLFLKDRENLVDFGNAIFEIDKKFREMASQRCGIPILTSIGLVNEFLNIRIPDFSSIEKLKDSYWDFLMSGFDFLMQTRKDFDTCIRWIEL